MLENLVYDGSAKRLNKINCSKHYIFLNPETDIKNSMIIRLYRSDVIN